MDIPTLKLNTRALIPAIGFGTWKLSEGPETVQAVSEAFKAGYRLIDTAKLYANERSVGEAVRASGIDREEIFVTTKLWVSDMGYQSALDAFDESIDRLGLDYVDLYLIHAPRGDRKVRLDSWRALSEIYERGAAKAVGVSNYSVEDIEELKSDSKLLPAVNQIIFNPFVYAEHVEILKYCKDNDIVVEAYSPLSQARQLDHPTITKIADKIGKTNAQVLLRWAIQHGTVPIPKSVNPQRMKENLEVFDFELSDNGMDTLNSLSR